MGCASCIANMIKKKFISYLAWTTTAFIAAACIAITSILKAAKIDKALPAVYILCIIVTVLACILFAYSIWAARCGGKKAKAVLGTCFIIFGVAILVCGIILIAKNENIVNKIRSIFDDDKMDVEVQKSAEDYFKCCGRDQCFIEYPDREDCIYPIRRYLDKLTKGGSPVLIILSLLLFLGALLCFIEVCSNDDNDGYTVQEDNRV
ncbi:hypothetical protein TRFO_03396 [Tritrichomonas foetus]|uniref:Tetraspanin family protein n=1 Tax=Tritrichomonas foetus TaxID=1144522 RepID=A0A1J4KT88_9EUKA|nr:hypothetical protein TRFO_03396 [Tritrichomonas foetus]|eukprot:OHT13004.1 hypothetical protein TRFO_03396 [Tritrichomonas foetus]